MTHSSAWRTAAAVLSVILSLSCCVEGVYRRNVTECEAFLSDTSNDPHNWLDSVSATGQIIEVTCETGFEPIRGVTPKEFCALAPPGMSYCIYPTMIYALRMTSEPTAYCIIPTNVDRTDDYLETYSTYYAKPYADCDVDHETQGYHFVYGETAEKHSLQSFDRSATCDGANPASFQYIDKLDGNQAYLKIESSLSDTDTTWWLYKVGNNLEYVMADGDKQTDQIWAIRDNNIIETDAQITAGNPATLEEQERLNIFFNFVINAPCREDQDCKRYEQNLICEKNQPIRNLPSGVGICKCPGDTIWDFQDGCEDRDDTACYDINGDICENGGSCSHLDLDMCPICDCPDDYTGATCSTAVPADGGTGGGTAVTADDCADVTCNGNGLCDPDAGSDTDDDNDEYLCLCDCNVSGTDCNNENPVRIHSLSTTFNSDCTEASLSYNRTSTFIYPAGAPELQTADPRPTYTLYLTTRLNYELNKNGGEWQEIDYTEDTDGNEPISIGTVNIEDLVPYRDYVSFITYDIPGRLDNCKGPTMKDPTIGTFRYDFTTCRPRFGDINTRAELQLTTQSCKDTRTRGRKFRVGCKCWECLLDVFAVPIDCPTVLPECQSGNS